MQREIRRVGHLPRQSVQDRSQVRIQTAATTTTTTVVTTEQTQKPEPIVVVGS